MKTVGTVVVTFNRKEMLRKNIDKLLKQTYKTKIFIIDNCSTDGTYEYIEDILKKNKTIEYVRLEENTGGSGGFSKGVEIAFNSKVDYIWGMDDDAFPEKDALEKLMKHVDKYPKNTCFWSNPDLDKFDGETKYVDDWFFVGFLLPRTIIEQIGLPRNDFFIYHDDSEYAYRIIKSNNKIVKVKDSVIVHNNISNKDNSLKKKFLGKELYLPKMPNWKMYYFVRNNILKYKWNDKNKYKAIFRILPPFLIKTLIVNPKQFAVANKGYFHGLFGLKGKRMTPSKPKKIMHLCTGFPISFNGGITNYVRSIAIKQKEMGMDVTVVGFPEKNDYNFKYIGYKNYYIKPFTLRFKKNYIAYNKIKHILKKEKPDLLHIHMMLDIDYRLVNILKKYNIKYVVSLHDYSFLCPRINMFRNEANCEIVGDKCSKCATKIEQTYFRNKIYKVLKLNREKGVKCSPNFMKTFKYNKELLENANMLLPVSNRVMEIYKNNGINNNYEVLHIGNITAEQFKEYKAKKRNKKDKINIVMLGNFSKIKGGEQFIKIVDNLSHDKFKFYFLGRSTEEEQTLMKKHDIINKGSYKQIELKEKLKEYDFGCVLSIWEDNAPQVVMELLNNNLPVIGTAMGGIPDFIKDKKNGFLFNPYDEKSFKELLNKLNKISIEQIEKMKENIRPTLTPKEHFDDMEKIYKKIM